MDELLHHCLRELAFDGDLESETPPGCNPSRLKDFIVDFYSTNTLHRQNTDNAFISFVWSLVVHRPTVRVGTVPPGLSSEVWIAPQASAKRKALQKGEEIVSEDPPSLDVIPDAKSRTLEDLEIEYGDRLRIAQDPGAILATVTGSHIRSPKISPMVYSALQIITRGRDDGVSVVELGQKSGYDQKTCFYLVRQLTDLSLVVKVRRGGAGTNFVIHRYFFERSPAWREIREEESQAETWVKKHDDDDGTTNLQSSPQPEGLDFTAIDTRHLSSMPLLRGRVIKLLKVSRNLMHPVTNMLTSIGFSNPTKSDRLFFRARLRELQEEGVIERVLVPHNKKKGSTVPCFRLVSETPTVQAAVDPKASTELDDPQDSEGNLKLSLTLHKQMIDLLEAAGSAGMTLGDLSTALCNFDKRTLELLLTRAEKNPPPAHLTDLRIVGVMETSGRERRHRYYTISGYRDLVEQEQLDKDAAGLNDADFTHVGGYCLVQHNLFYDRPDSLINFQDSFMEKAKQGRPRKSKDKDAIPVRKGRPRKPDNELSRPRKRKREEDDVGESPAPKKRGRPRKAIDEEATNAPLKKRSRPSKPRSDDDDSLQPPLKGKGREPDITDELGSKKITKRTASSGRPDQTDDDKPRSKRVRFDQDLTVEMHKCGTTELMEEPGQVDSSYAAPTEIDDGTATAELGVEVAEDGMYQFVTKSSVIHSEADVGPVSSMDLVDDASHAEAELVVDTPALHTQVQQEVLVEDGAKKPRPSRASTPKINVSQLRRENEAVRVLENLGGIVNLLCRDWYEGHIALLATLSKAGEPASGPAGTRTDKRTCTATFDALERKGRIRQLKTSVETASGLTRVLSLVYLPDVTEERLARFLAEVGRNPAYSTLSTPVARLLPEKVEYGPDPKSKPDLSGPGLLPMPNLFDRSAVHLDRLFGSDAETIRQLLLTEKTTLSQMYGTIVAKCLRTRRLHLLAVAALADATSAHVVSKESRILSSRYFSLDLPLGTYCQLVGPRFHSEPLFDFLSTESGPTTVVNDTPPEIQSILQSERARARSRVVELLDILRMLHLAVPLQPVTSDHPFIGCAPNGTYPTAFDFYPMENWSITSASSAPIYWHFPLRAPVHDWSASDTIPPFWKQVSVATSQDVSEYWDLLYKLLTQYRVEPKAVDPTAGSEFPVADSLVKVLRRSSNWVSHYLFSWHQAQYLKRFVDISQQTTPLDRGDDALLDTICWTINAPRHAVEEWYRSSIKRLARDAEKARLRSEEYKAEKKAAQEAKAALALRAAEARKLREKGWNDLVHNIHPGELSKAAIARVGRVKTAYLQSVSAEDTSKWENEISTALVEDKSSSRRVPTLSKRFINPRPVFQPVLPGGAIPLPIPVAINSSEKTVQELIALQESQKTALSVARAKSKTTEDNESGVRRRYRFQWNREYDELVRDAGVIIRARCRDAIRLDWGAFEQVFPVVPRNTVRQRFSTLKELPANDAYLKRLEDRWYSLWIQHRGTTVLPDEDPHSPTNFNLSLHVEFLRKHVDKNALRVGYSEAQDKPSANLPSSLKRLFDDFDVVENTPTIPGFDFLWSLTGEEDREKKLLAVPFVRTQELMYPELASGDFVCVAESVLKMVMGTPQDVYDVEKASSILQSIGETELNVATKRLVSSSVLSKASKDSQSRPGRMYKISEANQNALHGSVSDDLFQDALALEEISIQQRGWREWPLLATDGDVAALVQLVPEGEVEFKIDTSQAQATRAVVDWNSKKADDDHLETGLYVRFRELDDPRPVAEQSGAEPMDVDPHDLEETTGHGINMDGATACCRKLSDGAIDCSACLDEQWDAVSVDLEEEELNIGKQMLWIVGQGREAGVTKDRLVATIGAPLDRLLPIIHRLTEASIPLLMWMGYGGKLSLVSASHINKWTAIVGQEPMLRLFPRRWLNVHGRRINDVWNAALKAVMGTVVFRPGITLPELRWRLRTVYDRPELNDLLRHLCDEGFLKLMLVSEEVSVTIARAMDGEEERNVYCFLGEKHWYHV